jgi:hypothetical protein
MSPSRRRQTWAAISVAGVLLAFAPAVAGVRTLSQRDTDRIYAPMRTLVVEALHDGRLPLWNPHEATGKPLFAEGVHSVLHPISLLGAALAPSSVDFLILAYLATAALGAFVFAGLLGASPPASAGAALAYALSGYSVSMTGNLVFLAGLSTLPWQLASAKMAGADSSWGVVLAALSTACAFFSGDVQVALVGLALGALLAFDAGGTRGLARAFIGMVAGALLAGVQLASTYGLLPFTSRSLELHPAERVQWALSPSRLLEWLIPGLFRGSLADLPLGSGGEWIAPVFSDSIYLGAPLLFAASMGAASGGLADRRSAPRLLMAASLVLLWLALGHRLGARQALDWVPVWSRFRYSEKLMAPLTLCVCALGARGIDAFGTCHRSPTRRLALFACLLAALAALLVHLLLPGVAATLLGDAGSFYRSTLAAGLPHLLLALTALLLVERVRGESARKAALALLVALAPAAAAPFGAHLGSHAARGPTAMEFRTDAPAPRVAHPEAAVWSGTDPADYVDWSTQVGSLLLEPAANVASRVDTFAYYGAFEPLRFSGVMQAMGARWTRLARRFGLTHVAIPLPHDDTNPVGVALSISGGHLASRGPAFELWEVPHRSWAFFAQRAVASRSPESALNGLLALIVQGDDETVVLEAPSAFPTAPGNVLRVERHAESLEIEAEALGPALLVVQDAFWPGWRASIDGQPTEIFAADYLVRAVAWPKGRHVLEMVYDPPELRLGLAVSTVGALLTLALAAFGARRARIRGWWHRRASAPVQ